MSKELVTRTGFIAKGLTSSNDAYVLSYNTTTGTVGYLSAVTASAISLVTSQVTTTTTYTTSVTMSSTIASPDSKVVYNITAQSGALLFNTPTGSWTQSQILMIRIKDNGSASALTWATGFTAGSNVTLPTTTTINKLLYIGFVYNSDSIKFDLVATTQF